jgi:outer membrane usher protein
MVNFATHVGYQVLMTLLQANNTPVPFGALVTIENKTAQEPNTGIVGEAGQVYLSGLSEQGKLKVTWGKEADQQCLAAFNLAKVAAPSVNNPVRVLTIVCQGK